MEYKLPNYAGAFPSYLENSVLRPRDYYHTGIEEGLEKIVLNEEPEMERGVVDKVFSDKGRTLKATVKAFFNEILTRERLNSELLKRIDSDICKTDSYLDQIHFITKRQYTPDLPIAFARRRTQLEGQVRELEKEKRQEYLACWKDLMFLKKYLLSALKDYWNLSHKTEFMDYEENAQ
jgi:hypothetical protein